jgi:hypothetical protein
MLSRLLAGMANAATRDGVGLAECISEDGMAGVLKWYERQYGRWKLGVDDSERMIAQLHSESMSVL